MKIKVNASVRGLRPEIVLAIVIANDVFKDNGVELVLTEGTGGKHSIGSLHYVGQAIDLRAKDIDQALVQAIVKELKENLSIEYDVVHEEDPVTAILHIHIEFQPK